MRKDDLPQRECEICFGPVLPYTRSQRLLHWICWVVVIKLLPVDWMLAKPFKWMLPFCGNHAYACKCPDKIAALKAGGEG